MENINEKMSGEYFWGVFIPGAITVALLYYTIRLCAPQFIQFIPSNPLIQTIFFAAISYIIGIIIMQISSWIERKYYLWDSEYFPFVTVLENRRYSNWLELFNTKSFENLGFYIKKSAEKDDSELVRINTQSFFLYCRYLLDKNNLLEKASVLQAEYFLFRNMSVSLLIAAIICIALIISKLLYFPKVLSVNLLPFTYPGLIIMVISSLFFSWIFFKAGLKKRIKHTEEVYRTAYYLLKNI